MTWKRGGDAMGSRLGMVADECAEESTRARVPAECGAGWDCGLDDVWVLEAREGN